MPCHFSARFLGINQRLLASVRGEVPFLSGSKKFFFGAMALHAAYNIAAAVVPIGR